MIIACPVCATRFTIDPQLLGVKGRTVRCVRCKHPWHAQAMLITMPGDEVAEPDAPMIDGVDEPTPPDAPSATTTTSPVERHDGLKATAMHDAITFADPEFDNARKRRRNALIAALIAAFLLAAPVFVWRLMALEMWREDSQKSIALDGTPAIRLYQEEGRNILRIEGAIINNEGVRRPVPKLAAQGLNARGDTVKEWMIPLSAEQLEPGQRLSFSFTTPYSEQGIVDIAFHFR